MQISTEYVSSDYLHLNSCGIENLNEKDTNKLREYGRKDYHILYIHRGCCYTEIDGRELAVEEGNLILYRPDVKQKYSFKKKDNSISCYLHFTGSGCQEQLDKIFRDGQSVVFVGKSHSVREVFERMSGEYILKKPCFESVCAAYLSEFFAIVQRKLVYLRTDTSNKNVPAIDKVCLYMNERYNENVPLKVYAEYCNLSLGRFSHLFKETVGVSPMEYIISIRINKAKELLKISDFSAAEIAELCGFGNQNYFSRIFKEKTGVSPKRYAG